MKTSTLLSKIILGLALFGPAAEIRTHADTAIALDLNHVYGKEPGGIASGKVKNKKDGEALQFTARDRCRRRGGLNENMHQFYFKTAQLNGPSVILIGRNRSQKFVQISDGRSADRALKSAIAGIKAQGAAEYYVAATFSAL